MHEVETSHLRDQTRHERELGFSLGDLVRSDEHGIEAAVVTVIGSNYIELEWYNARRPSRESASHTLSVRSVDPSKSSMRLHFDRLDSLTVITDAASHLAYLTSVAGAGLEKANAEVRALMNRLTGNVTSSNAAIGSESSGGALVAMNAMVDPSEVRTSLETARDESIPELYRDIWFWTEKMTSIARLQLLMATSRMSPMNSLVTQLNSRLFTIELYAGLTESVYHFRKGAPANVDDKIHIFQRKLYMDEECLLDYDAGGMDFENLEAYFSWLSRPENMNRIMPFPKSIVAMQVRRKAKDRDSASLLDAFINIQREIDDKSTYLFIRNGENMYCLQTAVDFGPRLFPDMATYNPDQPLTIAVWAGQVRKLIPSREYEEQRALHDAYVRDLNEWEEAYARAGDPPSFASREEWMRRRPDTPPRPARRHSLDLNYNYHPFNESSVYYDDAAKILRDEMDAYNRFSLILQGLLDRSDVLAPHAAPKLWDADSFNQSIVPILEDRALYDGEAPDFEVYLKGVNANSVSGDHFTGQRIIWEMEEAEKENSRQKRDWRIRNPIPHKRFCPENNPGPGIVDTGTVSGKSARKVRFDWLRGRANGYYYGREGYDIRTSTSIPLDRLLNVSAYRPGDYLQFFKDPRTRESYLKWAPMLLTAEKWHASRNKG